jgi:hypothetical protein
MCIWCNSECLLAQDSAEKRCSMCEERGDPGRLWQPCRQKHAQMPRLELTRLLLFPRAPRASPTHNWRAAPLHGHALMTPGQ